MPGFGRFQRNESARRRFQRKPLATFTHSAPSASPSASPSAQTSEVSPVTASSAASTHFSDTTQNFCRLTEPAGNVILYAFGLREVGRRVGSLSDRIRKDIA